MRDIKYPIADFKNGFVVVYAGEADETTEIANLYFDAALKNAVKAKDAMDIFNKGLLASVSGTTTTYQRFANLSDAAGTITLSDAAENIYGFAEEE